MLMVDVRDGEPPDIVMQRLIAEGLPDATPADIAVFVTPQRPADIVDLGRVRWTPVLLGMLLAGLALAAVTHALVTTVRRRRRELALLRTLGFSRRQLSATVAWQATTFAAVAVAAGLPLGIAAGRWAWSMLADGLGVPPEPVTPTAVALVVPLAVLVSANLVAAVPAWRAGRTAPAVALRTE
jgi:ABC-type lipoprotein release transport system permease subunit